MSCKYILFLSSFLLSACAFIAPPPEPAAETRPERVEARKRAERPLATVLKTLDVCPNHQAISLLASGQYDSANVLLEEDERALQQSATAQQQYCTYLGLNLLHLLSASPYFNLAKAVKYQNRVQTLVDKSVGGDQGLLLSKALNEVMLQHTENNKLQMHIAELRGELRQKEEAIQRLKELTLETGS